MNIVTIIYKKKDKLRFLSVEDALEKKNKLKKQGWEHIASVDSAILLSNIYDECQEEYSSDEKINRIVKLFTMP